VRATHESGMPSKPWGLGAAVGLLVGCLGMPVSAQQSRASIIAAEQAEKATQATPYSPSRGEQIFLELKRDLLEVPSGFYPYFDSVYSGGGFTLGAGYRSFYGDRTFWDVKGLLSISGYKLIELSTSSPGHASERLDVGARVGWRDATQVAFYGTGIDSPEGDRANFRMKQLYAGGDVRVRPVRWVFLGAGLLVEDFSLEQGQGSFPSIEEVYTPDSAPGLGVSPTYVHSSVSSGIDWRPLPGYARRGGLYELSYHRYDDTDDTFTFDRLDGDIVQHLPILRENWVLSFHGAVRTTLSDTDVVPYFLLPALGSGSTLRGYSSWRFRDRHSLLLSGEFRWIPNRLGLDMALFYDTGKVTSRFDDLSLRGLKSDVGVGVRFHGPATTPLRIELARGTEGMRLVFAGSAAF
jgi:hypothetical protein